MVKKTLVTRLAEQAAEPDDVPSFERFKDLTKRLVAVPKAEIEELQAAERRVKTKRGALAP
jgi:hypothetical protein